MRILFLFLLLIGPISHAATITAFQSLTVMCIERVTRFSDLNGEINSPDRIKHLEEGFAVLGKVERAGKAISISLLRQAVPYLDKDPILAIEAEAVFSDILETVEAGSIMEEFLTVVRERPRQKVLATLFDLQQRYFAPSNTPPLTDPAIAERIGKEILEDNDLPNPIVEARIALKLGQLGEAKGFFAIAKAATFLSGIKTVYDRTILEDLKSLTNAMLCRLYFRLLAEEMQGPHRQEAAGLLHFYSGKNASQFLFDIGELRRGRSSFLMLLNAGLRAQSPAQTNTHTLAEARTMEMALGLYDSKPFYNQKIRLQLVTALAANPPKLPTGEIIQRHAGEIQNILFVLFESLIVDDRTDGPEAMAALQNIILLIGDPRLDQLSLVNWLQSLLGDRRSFSKEQFVRFLQEGNTVLKEIQRLTLSQRAVISREHRKLRDEELGPSFDLWIVNAQTGEVIEAVEIKQTEAPQKGSDIGGILKQATGKFDGVLLPPAAENRMKFVFQEGTPQSIRHLVAKKKLVIQIDWKQDPVKFKKGSITFIRKPNGLVEKWAGKPGAEKQIGVEDLFEDIATHFLRATDVHVFDAIEITSYDGMPVVSYFRSQDGTWGCHR